MAAPLAQQPPMMAGGHVAAADEAISSGGGAQVTEIMPHPWRAGAAPAGAISPSRHVGFAHQLHTRLAAPRPSRPASPGQQQGRQVFTELVAQLSEHLQARDVQPPSRWSLTRATASLRR